MIINPVISDYECEISEAVWPSDLPQSLRTIGFIIPIIFASPIQGPIVLKIFLQKNELKLSVN